MKKIFILVIMFSLLWSSGETPSNREIISTRPNQEFTLKLFSPNPLKYPDDWYTLSNPQINLPLVEFISSENIEPEKVKYRFRALKPGEVNINIYKLKGGKNSSDGLAYSVLVKIEK